MNSVLMTLKQILSMPKLVIGDEVLKHMECDYSDIKQRNYRRGKDFVAGLINSSIVHGIVGGNIVLYKLTSGAVLVLDGRSRLLGFHKAIAGIEPVNLNSLPYGTILWTIERGVTLLDESSYFSEYPKDIQEQVKNIEFQVYILDQRTCPMEKARDLFVGLNLGLQKMNRDQMNKNMFHGDMTKLSYELALESSLTQFISESDEKSDASTGFVNYIINQNISGSLNSEQAIRNMLKGYKSISKAEQDQIKKDVEKVGEWLSSTIDSNNKTFRKTANLCIVAYVLFRFDQLGIDVNKNIKKIKAGIENLAHLIQDYEGTPIGEHRLTKSQLSAMNGWHINGSALRSATAKKARAEILCDYISKELSAGDRNKIPRQLAK